MTFAFVGREFMPTLDEQNLNLSSVRIPSTSIDQSNAIDLQQTVARLNEAYNFVRELAAQGKTILLVGTKKQAQEAIEAEAKRCGMYFVNQRWLGGMLTNFRTI